MLTEEHKNQRSFRKNDNLPGIDVLAMTLCLNTEK